MNQPLCHFTSGCHRHPEDHHEGSPTPSNPQRLPPFLWKTEQGAGGATPARILPSATRAPAGEAAVPTAGLGVLGCKPLSFRPAQGTHSPNRKEPVEREMWSDNRCSRKRGKKLLLKWQ